MILLLMFLGLLGLVLVNVPIAVSLGIVALSGMILSSGMASLPNAALVLFDGSTKFPLIAIPLFILAGTIMGEGGIAHRIIDLAMVFVGRLRGGLGMVTIVSTMFFSGVCGSASADTAAIGSVTIPAMKKKK